VRWYAGVPTRLHPDDVPAGRARDYLFPRNLMHRELREAVDALWREAPPGVALPRGLHPFDENGTVIMPEATWQLVRGRLSPAARAHYARWPTT
jgi:hypothetical protein